MFCETKVLEEAVQAVQQVEARRGRLPKDKEGRPQSIENCFIRKLSPNISVNKSKKTPRNMRTRGPTRVNSSTFSSKRTRKEDTH